MKTVGARTRNPRLELYVGLALTLPASLTLAGVALWLALTSGATAALAPLALASLACLIGAALTLSSVFGERRRAALPIHKGATHALVAHKSTRDEALAHAEKMEALGLLAGGVAHDFNNLLHVIRNSLEILERQGEQADTRRYLDMIRRSADRAAALTRQLLAFSRRQPLDPRPLDPNELVGQVTELLRHSLGERITIHTVLGREVWNITADAGQLETALLNLAINARDAMSRVGLLTIETANATFDESVSRPRRPEVSSRPYVMIAVSDTGTGMAPDVAARACEPFFTTKEPGHGTGLGLSQVAGFAHRSGGHVRISSEPGRGTTVRIYLPKAGPVPWVPGLGKPGRIGSAARAWSIKRATKGDPLAVGASRGR